MHSTSDSASSKIHWSTWMLLGGIVAFLLALVVVTFAGCTPVKMGPFYPANARICGADPDCPVHSHCGFVAGHRQAVCLAGDSDFDAYPDTSPP